MDVKKFIFFKNFFYKFRICFFFLFKFLSINNKYIEYKYYKSKLNPEELFYFLRKLLISKKINKHQLYELVSLSIRLRNFDSHKLILKVLLRDKEWNNNSFLYIKYFASKDLKEWMSNVKINIFFKHILINLDRSFENTILNKYDDHTIKETINNIVSLCDSVLQNDLQEEFFYKLGSAELRLSEYLINRKAADNKEKKKKYKCAVLYNDPWCHSYGHYYYLDSFIKGVLLGVLDYDFIQIRSVNNNVSNYTLYKIYNNFLDKKFKRSIINSNCINYYPNMIAWKLKNEKIECSYSVCKNIQKSWTRKGFKSIVTIDNKIKKVGNKFLRFILKKKKPKFFVSLHVRENGHRVNDYLSLDQSRNANLKNYQDSVNYIGTKNGYVFRLGDKTKNNIKSNNYFDYGSSLFKSEFLDIFLMYISKFIIGTCSGPFNLGDVYQKKHNVLTNIPFGLVHFSEGSIGIPKLLFSTKNKKSLSLNHYTKIIPPIFFSGNKTYKNLNIEQIDNSSEDILSAVKEVVENYDKKKWAKSLKFRKKFPDKNTNPFMQSRIPIAQSFVKKYSNLFY
jgi:putative glycosyltransferase (TIGR04372 family)